MTKIDDKKNNLLIKVRTIKSQIEGLLKDIETGNEISVETVNKGLLDARTSIDESILKLLNRKDQ